VSYACVRFESPLPAPRRFWRRTKPFSTPFAPADAASPVLAVNSNDLVVPLVTVGPLCAFGSSSKNKIGPAMRAVACNHQGRARMGVSINPVISCPPSVLGSLLQRIAGVCTRGIARHRPLIGVQPAFATFIAAVLGGHRELVPRGPGRLVLGLLNLCGRNARLSNCATESPVPYWSLILLFRPARLLGKAQVERDEANRRKTMAAASRISAAFGFAFSLYSSGITSGLASISHHISLPSASPPSMTQGNSASGRRFMPGGGYTAARLPRTSSKQLSSFAAYSALFVVRSLAVPEGRQ